MPPSTSATHAQQRARLLEVTITRLHDQGPEALRARDLTAEIGASTQALYTLFGGMPGLLEAVVTDGFARLGRYLQALPQTDDPVADHFLQGWSYAQWALTHQHLYRLMSGVDGSATRRSAGFDSMLGDAPSSAEVRAALEVLLRSVRRMIDAGRIRDEDPLVAGRQFISATHGYVLLEIAGAFGPSGNGLATVGELAVNLMVGLGDTREAAQRSLESALGRMAEI